MKHTYTNLFIEIGKYTAATVIVVVGCITTAAIASSQAYKWPSEGPVIVNNASLSVKAPKVNVCPAKAQVKGWIQTNKPGSITYTLAAKNGETKGPFQLDAVKSIKGGLANFTTELAIKEATDTDYRIMVSSVEGTIKSSWVPLKANCALNLAG